MSSDSDEEELLLLLALAHSCRKRSTTPPSPEQVILPNDFKKKKDSKENQSFPKEKSANEDHQKSILTNKDPLAILPKEKSNDDALTINAKKRKPSPKETNVPKRIWVHNINKDRKDSGEYHRLCEELSSNEDLFFKYFRMSQESFEELHEIIRPKISKCTTNWREPISTRERLVICLRYMATGESFNKVAHSFRVGRSTVGKIITEVSQEIWNMLQPKYLPPPTEDTWNQSEIGYRELWNFPNCIGSIDGKHVIIKTPNNSDSKYCSVVFLTIIDPFYKFLAVDVGKYGSEHDIGIFEVTKLYTEYIHGKTLLPDKPFPGTDDPVPQVLIGDEGFILKPYLMRPFPKAIVLQDDRKANFNKRLSHARSVVENTFDILTRKWRFYSRPMECNMETAIHIVKASMCLHNYVQSKQEISEPEEKKGPNRALKRYRATNKRSTVTALEVRDKFLAYFNQ